MSDNDEDSNITEFDTLFYSVNFGISTTDNLYFTLM